VTDYPTDIHGPSETAREQTDEVAVCQVCGCQWQVKSTLREDAKGCSFCDAPASAITIISEAPTYGAANT